MFTQASVHILHLVIYVYILYVYMFVFKVAAVTAEF